jgi:TonB family protein
VRGAFIGPALLYKVEPDYSDEGRKARCQGTIILAGDVDVSGRLCNIRIVRGLGLGLDEKAVEAVLRWKFRPGYRDGKPVVAPAWIEVTFRLL